MNLRESLLLGVSLLTLFNPPSAIATFIALTRPFPEEVQRRMAWQIALCYALTLLVFVWAGRLLLEAMGISVALLRLTGGFVLLVTALPMVTQYHSATPQEAVHPAAAAQWRTVTVVPLTFPISVGGATAATVIAAGGLSVPRAAMSSIVCLLMAGVVWASFRVAQPFARRVGPTGLAALTGASGIILLCIAFQLLTAGARDLLPGLGTH